MHLLRDRDRIVCSLGWAGQAVQPSMHDLSLPSLPHLPGARITGLPVLSHSALKIFFGRVEETVPRLSVTAVLIDF